MIKAKLYKGQNLKGMWQFTRKVDGVRMLRDEKGNPVSRANKPLYNLELVPRHIKDAEIFLNSWGESVSMVRTQNGTPVPPSCVYSLNPLDERLLVGYYIDPTPEFVAAKLKDALALGDEGLVIRQGDKWLKVKPVETYDVVVTGYQAGTGQMEGMMGALLTDMGKVGTGFVFKENPKKPVPPEQFRQYWTKRHEEGTLIGTVIEVECMELTDSGKFRHPRFVRERFDK